jgi:plasmid stability protein
MAVIHISERLLERLRRRAERENRSVEAVVESILDSESNEVEKAVQVEQVKLPGHITSGSGAALLWAVEQANIDEGDVDNVSERSREILDAELVTYLKSRMGTDNGA